MKGTFGSFVEFLRSSKRAILLITIVVVATLVISSMISIWLSKDENLSFPSLGTIKALGIEAYWEYRNGSLENETREIDWGTIFPGDSIPRTLYVQSISNLNTTLHLDTANWRFLDSDNNIVPEPLNSYMNLTWDYNNATIKPDQIVQVTLTLSASSSSDFIRYLVTHDVTNFSFDIIISTSEYSD